MVIFTDLDRTLLSNKGKFSEVNLKAMQRLKESGIKLVIATGRNILSANMVLKDEHLFDYLIFSSGAGIIDWKKKEIIYQNHLTQEHTKLAINILLKHQVDFMVHDVIPANHQFHYWLHHSLLDFKRRIRLYKKYAKPLEMDSIPKKASQLLAVLTADEEYMFAKISAQLKFAKVIRATSPLDHRSIWLEIFPINVSKGHTAKWLCDRLKIDQEDTIGIGNDYNDLDLLEWTDKSYVVENAPQELKEKFIVVASNEQNGFTEVVNSFLQE